MSFIAGIVQGVGAIAEGVAARRAAAYTAGIAKLNAAIARQNAVRALQRGQIEQQELDFSNLALMGAQIAVQGASGVSVASGSARAARDTAQRLARLDALRVRENAQLEARNFMIEALGLKAQEQLAMQEGRSALLAGFINAGASVIAGASRSPRFAARFG